MKFTASFSKDPKKRKMDGGEPLFDVLVDRMSRIPALVDETQTVPSQVKKPDNEAHDVNSSFSLSAHASEMDSSTVGTEGIDLFSEELDNGNLIHVERGSTAKKNNTADNENNASKNPSTVDLGKKKVDERTSSKASVPEEGLKMVDSSDTNKKSSDSVPKQDTSDEKVVDDSHESEDKMVSEIIFNASVSESDPKDEVKDVLENQTATPTSHLATKLKMLGIAIVLLFLIVTIETVYRSTLPIYNCIFTDGPTNVLEVDTEENLPDEVDIGFNGADSDEKSWYVPRGTDVELHEETDESGILYDNNSDTLNSTEILKYSVPVIMIIVLVIVMNKWRLYIKTKTFPTTKKERAAVKSLGKRFRMRNIYGLDFSAIFCSRFRTAVVNKEGYIVDVTRSARILTSPQKTCYKE